jgi:uncharacterized protein (DUF952 family)
MILHITTQKDWEQARVKGEYTVPSLHTDGFIHCSTLAQAVDTANLFFKGQSGLVLLCIDERKLKSECKYEDPAGGNGNQHDPRIVNLFPHIYGPINISAIIKMVNFHPNANGLFELPEELLK